MDDLDQLTDKILSNLEGLPPNGVSFFGEVFQSAMDMAETVFRKQRVSGKQTRAIHNWTTGVRRWLYFD